MVRRALLEAWSEATPISADALPAEAVTALAERLAEADPGADLEFALNCPAAATPGSRSSTSPRISGAN